MTAHVSDEALVDLALGEGAAAERSHLATCESCARRVEELRQGLELARRAEVPEPSPLYWQALQSGVSRRIAQEKARGPRFAVLAPLAAAAGIVAVLAARQLTEPRPAPAPAPVLAAWSALPAADEDEGLQVLEGVALASGDLAEWDESKGLGGYLAGLSDDESGTLAETLRQRGQGGES